MLLEASASIETVSELNLRPMDVCSTDAMRNLLLSYRKGG
jgi:hypothetical protein